MKRFLLLFTYFILMPSVSRADDILYQNGKKVDLDPAKFIQTASLQTGTVSLNFSDQSIQSIALADYPTHDMKPSLFVGVAEASMIPSDSIIQNFLTAQRKIQGAKSLKEVQEAATSNYIKPLTAKVLSGADERIVVSMLQTLRPEHIQIQDVRSQDNAGKLAVTGESSFGKVHGIVDMVMANDGWKIDRETWFSDQKQNVTVENDLLSVLKLPTMIEEPERYKSLAITDTPDVRLNRNTLNLRKAHPNIRKRSFMFIYYLEKRDHFKERLTGVTPKAPAPMHVLWTGPNNMLPEQKVVQYEYPVDFSIADDKDGFMPGGMNLQLPKKKPNGVTVSAMFTF